MHAPKADAKRLSGFEGLTVTQIAPNDITAADLAQGMSPQTADKLTPAAAKLTKADLIALNSNPKAEAAKHHLTVTDLNSIKQAFSMPRSAIHANAVDDPSLASVTVYACCCPCCCAASVPVEVAIQ
jgi:hypothetical protein